MSEVVCSLKLQGFDVHWLQSVLRVFVVLTVTVARMNVDLVGTATRFGQRFRF